MMTLYHDRTDRTDRTDGKDGKDSFFPTKQTK